MSMVAAATPPYQAAKSNPATAKMATLATAGTSALPAAFLWCLEEVVVTEVMVTVFVPAATALVVVLTTLTVSVTTTACLGRFWWPSLAPSAMTEEAARMRATRRRKKLNEARI